jgi:UDP-N-acetyl-D-mannosaminuronic acid dehydrogenase
MKNSLKTIAVIGLGYIGLPAAALLANRGIRIIGVDTNPETVNDINHGAGAITEPDLKIRVQQAVASGQLSATDKIEPADAFIIAVPTPLTCENKADTQHIAAVADQLAPVLQKNNLIILESTLPTGETAKFVTQLARARPDLKFPTKNTQGHDIFVSYCPERVLPGNIVYEMIHNDRVIGGTTPECAARAAELYSLFVKGQCILTDAPTAEITKLAENAYRDVNIAFANELSLVCEQAQVDVWELIRLANRHPRVNILQPGPGVGGHCLAVDPWFLSEVFPTATTLIQSARQINDQKPYQVVTKILEASQSYPQPIIACLGLTYKANVSDIRQSPALTIVTELAKTLTSPILVIEPHLSELPESLPHFKNIVKMNAQEALQSANVIAILVGHDTFGDIDWKPLKINRIIDPINYLSRGQETSDKTI